MPGIYQEYAYDGPVMVFDRCVANHWKGRTMATSPAKAKSNLIYQFKKQNNMIASTRVTLPNKVVNLEMALV